MALNPRRLAWDASKSAAQNASGKLPPLAAAYFRAGRKLLDGQPSARALHQFRLETKRFRYTLELFRPCYGPGLDRRLALLRGIQNFLGEINDCAQTLEMLGDEQRKIAAFLERRMAQKAGQLRRYWRQTFDPPGRERWWSEYLRRFAGGK